MCVFTAVLREWGHWPITMPVDIGSGMGRGKTAVFVPGGTGVGVWWGVYKGFKVPGVPRL